MTTKVTNMMDPMTKEEEEAFEEYAASQPQFTPEEGAIAIEQVRNLYADIMSQLIKSDRFGVFFHTNYDLKKEVDEEKKEINYLLVEVPPEIVVQRLKAKTKEIEDQKNKIKVLDTGLTVATSLDDVKKYIS